MLIIREREEGDTVQGDDANARDDDEDSVIEIKQIDAPFLQDDEEVENEDMVMDDDEEGEGE